MKKLIYFLAALISFTFFSVRGWAAPVTAQEQPPNPPNPAAAAAAFLDGIKAWDGAFANSLSETLFTDGSGADAILAVAMVPILDKLDYRVGNAKTEGLTAEVDLTITAADVKDAVRDLVVEAAGLMALRHFTGLPIDVEKYALNRLADILREDNLLTVSTNCTMYLIMGGDGEWKIDLSDARNLTVLNAAGGGILPNSELEKLITAMDTISS
ncbi:MAG: hypothetical protein FWH02_07990 [Oscillospiraceae bacterium]|nr:hypothetical protein [Oscillospiraceae bacterium]